MWEKWIEARGGRDRLSKIREIKCTSEMIYQGMKLEYVSYSKGADKYRLDQKVMGITATQAVDGESAWMTDRNTGLRVDWSSHVRTAVRNDPLRAADYGRLAGHA